MIISPPFLPHGTYNSDDAFVEAAMIETNEGFYPVSGAFCWHNGIHLVNPDGTNQAPVRAIADGTVIYRQDPTPPSQDPNHPQNYNPHSNDHPSWTDNGMVIIEHSTEIGATGTAPTTITYYSVYYHLSRLDANLPQVGKPIYRKMPLGQAGQIYGNLSHEIHFEICCNADNLQRITGRHAEPNAVENKSQAPAQDGRTDSVFGSMYFYLPPDTPTVSGNQPTTSNAQTTPLNTPIWVRIAYGGTIIGQAPINHGSVSLVSYSTDGNQIGDPVPEKDFEYNLYAEANKRHTQQPQISPCDWYDLLRFGRKLDGTAIPATVAHWRQIRTPAGLVWANLNAANVKKFSDADFLPVMGWNFYQDDPDHHDQRCNSTDLQTLIRNPDASDEHRMEPEQLMQRIERNTDSTRTNKLKRVIAKFATEWDQTTIAQRCEWIKHEPEFNENPDNWSKLLNHVQGITCTDLPQAYKDALWHFNPKEFVRHMRKCLWVSKNELGRVLLEVPSAARLRAQDLTIPTNEILRKYLIGSNVVRIAHFFAQVGHETGWWLYRREVGDERYFRTMYEVITPQEAGEDYDHAVATNRNLPSGRRPIELQNPGNIQTTNRPNYISTRPGQIANKAASMYNGAANSANGGMVGDGARFRGRGFLQITGRKNYKNYSDYRGIDFTIDPHPDLMASDDLNACDASGFYWVRGAGSKIADEGSSSAVVLKVGGFINRGSPSLTPAHATERQDAFDKIWKYLNDN